MNKALICFVCLASSAFGIGFKNSAQCVGASTSALNCSISIAVDAGDAVVYVAPGQVSYTVTSNCGLTFAAPPGYPSSPGVSTWLDLRVALNAPITSATCTITHTRTSGTDSTNQFILLTYSGVGAVGQSFNGYGGGGSTGTSMTCPVAGRVTTLKPTSAGNYVVAAWKVNVGNPFISTTTVTANSPATQRITQVPNGIVAMTGADAMVTSGNVGQAMTLSSAVASPNNTASLNCSFSHVELVASANTSVRTALLSDATQTVLLGGASGNNYVLPASGLSATWCTYVMPITSATSQVSVQSPALLNNATSAIMLEPWQMSRVCQGQPTASALRRMPHSITRPRMPGAVTAGAYAGCGGASLDNCIIDLSIPAGSTVVVAVYGAGNTPNQSSVTDLCGNTWTAYAPTATTSTARFFVSLQSHSCSAITANRLVGTGMLGALAQIYYGVQSVQGANFGSSTLNANPITSSGLSVSPLVDGNLNILVISGTVTPGNFPPVSGWRSYYRVGGDSGSGTNATLVMGDITQSGTASFTDVSIQLPTSIGWFRSTIVLVPSPELPPPAIGYWMNPPIVNASGTRSRVTVHSAPVAHRKEEHEEHRK